VRSSNSASSGALHEDVQEVLHEPHENLLKYSSQQKCLQQNIKKVKNGKAIPVTGP
jgi:hypothetical protein